MIMKGQNGWQSTEAGQHFQEKLTDEHTLTVLNRLLDKIDSLEQTVEKIAIATEQGPGYVSMVTDMVDETVRNSAARGVDIEQRLGTALHLAERLTAPETVEKLDQLIRFAEHAPGLMSMTTDIVDETMRKSSEKGIDIGERLGQASVMLEKLTAPETMEKLNQLMILADQAPGLISMFTDIVDEAMSRAKARGIDLEAHLDTGLQLAERITSPEIRDKAGDMLDINVLKFLATSGKALAEVSNQPVKKVGPFGALRALNNPDMQRVLGFLLAVGKNLGQQMQAESQQ